MTDVRDRIARLSPEQRALLERRLDARAASAAAEANLSLAGDARAHEPIAIIGMGCRFPGGVRNVREFWALLRDGVDAVTEVPRERWDANALYDADPSRAGTIASRWGGFVRDADLFDAAAFGISPREAVEMDPQQRVLLEVACEALDDAGQTREAIAGSNLGVFVGVHGHASDYLAMQNANVAELDGFSGTGTAHNLLAGRLSYVLDAHGPAVVIDTACSSSLVAVHLAVNSLRAGESSLAIAGGVNLILSPNFTIAASRMHMLAPDGRCKAFDQRANGFVRSEGCGVVVLKRLADARADGDAIVAVIRGSAINQDGHTNGITAPNGLAQRGVIERALANAGVAADAIGFVEAHGTGTALGDPIEVEALATTVGQSRTGRSTCYVGSVKTNLGHLEGAAGVAGLIKAALVVHRGEIPPNLHFTALNPHIDVRGTRLAFPSERVTWTDAGTLRRAGVSSFGWSGTNAHVIVEEAPAVTAPADESRGPFLLPLSARTPEALTAVLRRFRDVLREPTSAPAHDLCWTAAARRTHYAYRAAFVGQTTADLAAEIDRTLSDTTSVNAPTRPTRTVFVFPGQGSQWLGMARTLLDVEPAFAAALAACDTAILAECGWSVRDELTADAARSRLHEIDVVQPVLFAVSVALAALWRSWGIVPDVVVGHSMGEVAAAHVAGALTLHDAVAVICRRSRRLRDIAGRGGMAVVELSVEDATQALKGYEDRLSIAVSNGPRSTVIAGDTHALDTLIAALGGRDVFCRLVKVDVASHSPQVDALRDVLLDDLADVRGVTASIPICSTVTGAMCTGHEFTAAYWLRNLREPVRFYDVLQSLLADGCTTFVEMSPHPILLSAVQDAIDAAGASAVALPSLRRDADERHSMLTSLGELYAQGAQPSWPALWSAPASVVPLPDYPWQHERFWLTRSAGVNGRHLPLSSRAADTASAHPLLGDRIDVAMAGHHLWMSTLDLTRVPFVAAHQLHGAPVLAASAYVELLLAVGRACFGAVDLALLDVVFERVLYLSRDATSTELQVHAAASDAEYFVEIFARGAIDRPWVRHAHARVRVADAVPERARETSSARAATGQEWAASEESPTALSGADLYAMLARRGVGYDTPLRSIETLARDGALARATLALPERDVASRDCVMAPGSLDACFQVAVLGIADLSATTAAAMPSGVARIRYSSPTGSDSIASVAARWHNESAGVDRVDVRALAADGAVTLALDGVRMHALDDRQAPTLGEPNSWLYDVAWDAAPTGRVAGPLGRWIVLADSDGPSARVAQELASQLSARGGEARVLSIDDGLPDALDAARGTPGVWRGIVHCAALDAAATSALRTTELRANPVPGFASLLTAVHALDRAGWPDSTGLWVITRGAVAVHQRERATLNVAQAAMQGMTRAIAAEHPDRFRASVDLDPLASIDEQVSSLVDLLGADGVEAFVARRGETLFVPRLLPLSPPSPGSPTAPRRIAFRSDASYLLTGGLSGIGASVAFWMIARGARRLVIFGRTELPPRSEWGALPPSDPRTARVRAMQQMERLGASVHYQSVDVGDAERVHAALDEWHAESWPAIRGVVHSAAVIEDRQLAVLDRASLARVFEPKALGAWNLHTALPDLDWFVLFSSLSSIWPSPGHWGYAAANAFLDALALYRQAHGAHALSVSWGLWADAGHGATASGQRTLALLADEGLIAFAADDGLRAFDALRSHAVAHAAVMALDRARVAQRHDTAQRPPLLQRLLSEEPLSAPVAPTTASHTFADTLRLADPSQRAGLLESRVSDHAATVLRLSGSRIDPQTPLGAYGLNSILGLELRHRLERDLALRLSATLIWNYPTVSALSAHLAERIVPTEAAPTADVVTAAPVTSDAVDGLLTRMAALSDDDALAALRKTKPGRRA